MNRQFQLASKRRTVYSDNLNALFERSFSDICKCFDSRKRNGGTQKWVDFTHAFWHMDYVEKTKFQRFLRTLPQMVQVSRLQFQQQQGFERALPFEDAVVLTPKSEVTKVLVREIANQLPVARTLSRFTGQKWNGLPPRCRSALLWCRYTAFGRLSGRSSWQRLGMCFALNTGSL